MNSVRGSPRSRGGAHLEHHLVARDHLLAGHVTAALRGHLVFELDGGARGLELAHRAADARLGAVAGVGIDDHGGSSTRHAPHALDDLGEPDEADVGQAEVVRGERVAPVVERLDAGPLGDLRREAVVCAEGDDAPGSARRDRRLVVMRSPPVGQLAEVEWLDGSRARPPAARARPPSRPVDRVAVEDDAVVAARRLGRDEVPRTSRRTSSAGRSERIAPAAGARRAEHEPVAGATTMVDLGGQLDPLAVGPDERLRAPAAVAPAVDAPRAE